MTLQKSVMIYSLTGFDYEVDDDEYSTESIYPDNCRLYGHIALRMSVVVRREDSLKYRNNFFLHSEPYIFFGFMACTFPIKSDIR